MNKKVPLDFGEKLKSIREQRGVSKSELAELVGVSQPYITQLENGSRKDPGFSLVQKFCIALNVPIEIFLDKNIVPLYSIIDHLPKDLQEFVLSQESIPYIEVAKECVELDLSPEALKLYIQALAKAKQLSKNVKA